MKVKLVDWESAKAIAREKEWDGSYGCYVYGIGINRLPWGETVEAESYDAEKQHYFIKGFGVPLDLIERGEPNG